LFLAPQLQLNSSGPTKSIRNVIITFDYSLKAEKESGEGKRFKGRIR